MSLFALGLNHTTAPVAVRERVAFAPDMLADALRALTRGEAPDRVLDTLSRNLTNKLMHGPTRLLNEAPSEARGQIEDLVQRLYPLHDRES